MTDTHSSKIRNLLSPYKNLIAVVKRDDPKLKEVALDSIPLNERCLSEIIERSDAISDKYEEIKQWVNKEIEKAQQGHFDARQYDRSDNMRHHATRESLLKELKEILQ